MMNKLYSYSILLTACFFSLLTSCKTNGHINLGGDDGLTLELADSVKVLASTYLLNALPTSNTGIILSGALDDPEFGKTKASSYMQLKTAFSNSSLPEDAAFDSLNLVLKYSGYTYGDTTVAQRLMVNRLVDRIVLDKVNGGIENEERPVFVDGDAIYSTGSFKFDPELLGERMFKPRPRGKDSVLVSLSKSLGAELLHMVLKKDKKVTDAEEFQDYFKGIVIRSENGKSINGFKADSVKMLLHYHFKGSDGIQKRSMLTFALNLRTHQFNRLETDRKDTKLNGLGNSYKEIQSDKTDHQVYVQAGTGIVTKLQLPGLLEFIKEPKVIINKMQLIIETRPANYMAFKPPASLILFIANSSNTPKAVLKGQSADGFQQAYFQKGDEAGSNGKYVFELADYAQQLKKGEHKNTSLLLSVPLSALTTGVDRLVIKGNQQVLSIKTKILYTKY